MLDKYSYRVTWSDDDCEFVGLCAEFPGLSWLSKTQDAAFKGIRKLIADVVKDMKKNNEPIPDAIATKRFSGKFMVRIPPGLHRELALGAREANVSLNRYVASKLAQMPQSLS
jgi:predicted HicB family RNase H-like nuclease